MLYWLGLEPRLRSLLSDPIIAKHMFNMQKKRDPNAEVRNIRQSKGWEVHVTNDETDFANGNEGRNLAIRLHMDGFQNNRRTANTLTPITCQVLNLPENLRHRAEFNIMVALIPGPREPKNYNAYTVLSVREFQRLYDVGMEMDDPLHPGTPITIRVKLVNINADIPAFLHILYQQGASAHDGCFKCYIKVSSVAVIAIS